MAGSVGNAYLNVVPKVDSAAAASAGTQAGSAMSGGLTSTISAGAVAIGNIISNAAIDAASKLGAELSKTFTNYADYEQLKGGVETIFGEDAAATVKANAQAAFSSAGMSANDYMENVTGFSASLIQSLGGDTQKAAEVANTAMVDMSDNANKMGTDMESITNAYQGFAKQNYTMLDNLKLGYGGTKEEMERLLADAGKISGQKFDISSYSDVIEAIHVMQESMGIAGATSEEASSTISGSMGQAKAAWENFLTAVGDGGRSIDMSAAIQNLVSSVGTMLQNVVPEVVTIIGTIGELILSALPDSISGPLSSIASGIASFLSSLAGVMQSIVMPIFMTLAPIVSGAMSLVLSIISQVIDFINSNVMPTVQSVAAYVMPIVTQVAMTVSSAFQQILSIGSSVFSAIMSIVMTVWPVISQIITTAVTIVGSIITAVWPTVSALITGAMNTIRGVAAIVWPFISNAVKTAATAISTAITGISAIIGSVQATFDAIKDAIKNPIDTAKRLVSDAMDTIKNVINNAHLRLPDIKVPHFNINGGELPWGIGGKGYPPSISIDWYARGGYVDDATLIGAGERGGELIWPSYAPYLDKYADALASRIGDGGNNVFIDGARVNDDAAIQDAILNLFSVLERRGAMNVGTV